MKQYSENVFHEWIKWMCSRHKSRKLKFNAATLTRIWFDTDLSICCLYRFFFAFFCCLFAVQSAFCNSEWWWWWLCSLFTVSWIRESFFLAKFIISKLYDFLMNKFLLFFFVYWMERHEWIICTELIIFHSDNRRTKWRRKKNQLTIPCPCYSSFFCFVILNCQADTKKRIHVVNGTFM